MNSEEEKRLFEEVKANQAKLRACKKHLFAEFPNKPPYKFGLRLTCANCQGKMAATDALHYVEGYKAAGGNPNDVIPDFQ